MRASLSVPDQVKRAFAMALEVRGRAHAPYSRYPVGAAVKARGSDLIALGCNVENAAFPSGACAEANAVGQMVAQIHNRGPIEFVVVVTKNAEGAAPCGNCRQIIAEFGDQQTLIYLASLEGIRRQVTLDELLPLRYCESDLHAGCEVR